MICQKCGKPLDDSARFCPGCGAPGEPAFCCQCGAKFPENALFCPACGVTRNVVNARSCDDSQTARPVGVSDCLVWSVVSTVVFFPVGLGALILSILARDADGRGERSKAHGYATCALVWNIALLVVVLVGGLAFAAFWAFLAFGLSNM